jgi:hypothetical protein
MYDSIPQQTPEEMTSHLHIGHAMRRFAECLGATYRLDTLAPKDRALHRLAQVTRQPLDEIASISNQEILGILQDDWQAFLATLSDFDRESLLSAVRSDPSSTLDEE